MIDELINEFFPEFELKPNIVYVNYNNMCFVMPSKGPLELMNLCRCTPSATTGLLGISSEIILIARGPYYQTKFKDQGGYYNNAGVWSRNIGLDIRQPHLTEFRISFKSQILDRDTSSTRYKIIRDSSIPTEVDKC